MYAILLSGLLAWPGPQDSEAPPDPVAAELKAVCVKAVAAKSYAFESVQESTGSAFGGRRGGDGRDRRESGGEARPAPTGGDPKPEAKPEVKPDAKPQAPPAASADARTGDASGRRGGSEGPVTVKGRVQKGLPAELERDGVKVFRLDQQLVYQRDGSWELYQSGESGRGSGGAPPAGGRPGGTQGGGDLRQFFSLFQLTSLAIPDELLAKIDTTMTAVTREEKEGKVLYSGALSATAADEFSGARRFRQMAERGGGGGATLTTSGTMRITVADGMVEKIEVEAALKSGQGDSTRKLSITLSGWNATAVEVPREVLAKLST